MRRLVRAAALSALVLSACTSGSSRTTAPSPTSPPSPPETSASAPSPTGPTPTGDGGSGNVIELPPPATGAEAADAVQARLCKRPPAPRLPRARVDEVPDVIREVERQVEEVRGLEFTRPVAVDPVTHDELVKGLKKSFDHSFPTGLFGRRTRAWQTVGVIPGDTSLRGAIESFLSSQVIGFYDPASKQLVFIGTDDPSPLERITLAHELTHANDDQHFDLTRLNRLENACDDEREMAALGAIEGSAQFFALSVARRFFSPSDLASLGSAGGQGIPPDVPPFLQAIEIWPYIDGLQFITELEARGGLDEVNDALRDLPASTEQVMHPERYPSDVPTPVEVGAMPEGAGDWKDLDVMDVGEEWVKAMLDLRVAPDVSARAAEGWDGGQYRAWSRGDDVAVVLQTAWDTRNDAVEFAAVAQSWLESGTEPPGPDDARIFLAENDRVVVAFGSSANALDAALSVIGRSHASPKTASAAGVVLAILNGTDLAGLAACTADELSRRGYVIPLDDQFIGTTARRRGHSILGFRDDRGLADARRLNRTFFRGTAKLERMARSALLPERADVVVILGRDSVRRVPADC